MSANPMILLHLRTHNPKVAGSNPAPATKVPRFETASDMSSEAVSAFGVNFGKSWAKNPLSGSASGSPPTPNIVYPHKLLNTT